MSFTAHTAYICMYIHIYIYTYVCIYITCLWAYSHTYFTIINAFNLTLREILNIFKRHSKANNTYSLCAYVCAACRDIRLLEHIDMAGNGIFSIGYRGSCKLSAKYWRTNWSHVYDSIVITTARVVTCRQNHMNL